MMRGRRESLASWKRRLAKLSRQMRRKPGASWRIRAVGRTRTLDIGSSKREVAHVIDIKGAKSLVSEKTVLDEVCIDDWLHLEQMDDRYWWMRVGEYVLWITIPKKGPPQVTVRREPQDRLLTRIHRSDRELRAGKVRKLR
jgi:hypothetical protein